MNYAHHPGAWRAYAGSTAVGLVISATALLAAAPADAATATSAGTYTCTTPAGGSFELPADISLTSLPTTLVTGVPVPAGTPFSLGLDPATLSTALGTTVLTGNYTINQLTTQAGASAISNTLTSPLLTQLGTSLTGVNGTLGGFTPTTGNLALPLPTSFSLAPLVNLPGVNNAVNCTLDVTTVTPVTNTGGSSGTGQTASVSISKQTAKIKAHQIGKSARLLVKVNNQTGAATGTVLAKLHGKKVGEGTLRHGTLRLRLHKLRKGTVHITITYGGDQMTNPARKNVRLATPR